MAATKKSNSIDDIRLAAEADLVTFIRLVAPKTVLGAVHEELCSWWSRDDAKPHQVVLLPRDHAKSRMVAYRAAWHIVKQPDIRILYISATSGLAEAQLKFIKDILTNPITRRYWPDLINEEEGKREKWTNSEISVDHPLRKEEAVRDPTVFTGGLTTSLTGRHCDIIIMDDVVVYENAYTDEGRNKVKSQYSLLASIQGGEALVWVVGTRYHPKDLYSDLVEMKAELYNDNDEVIGFEPVYETFERAVEDRGDGTGQFLWPVQIRSDGKRFGFDARILATKRAQYLDRTQFRAQYYNDPNDPGSMNINRDKFQYYDKKMLTQSGGNWFIGAKKLNVYASIDFAYSLKKRSDYTALIVIGIDRDGCVYVLDLDRFKADRISEYFQHILDMHKKWSFRKLAAEVTAAQQTIVNDLKDNYFRPQGLFLSVEEIKPNRHQGSKEERMAAILEPRYDNMSMWHYKGGHCQTLEDELVLTHPPHDDCMDALATAISIAVAPTGMLGRDRSKETGKILYHPRFGGVQA